MADQQGTTAAAAAAAAQGGDPVARTGGVSFSVPGLGTFQSEAGPFKLMLLAIVAIAIVAVLLGVFMKDFRYYVFCVTGETGFCQVTKNESADYISAATTNNIIALAKYRDRCSVCQFKEVASERIIDLTAKKNNERLLYEQNAGKVAGLLQYIKECQLCEYSSKASDEITGLLRSRDTAASPLPIPIPQATVPSPPVTVSTVPLSPAVQAIVAKPLVSNGTYRAHRGYVEPDRPSPNDVCKEFYVVENVAIQDGTIKFESDRRTWTGTIDQRTGMIDISDDGITPQMKTTTYIRGSHKNAQAYNGYCGRGNFKILVN